MEMQGIYQLFLRKHGLIDAFMQSLFGWLFLLNAGEKECANVQLQSAVFEREIFLSFKKEVHLDKIASIYNQVRLEQAFLTDGEKSKAMYLAQAVVDKSAFIEECKRQKKLNKQIKSQIIDREENLLLQLEKYLDKNNR